MSHTPRVVIIGGGFGGLHAARSLGARGVAVTLIDRHNYHLFQPLLYQVATSGLNPADIAYPLRAVFHRTPQVHVRVGEVTGVDLARRLVRLADGGEVAYDHLVLATGTTTADFGVPGVAELALGLKGLEDAVQLRGEVLRRFEEADVDPSLLDRGWLTVVIAGGGPTGVEMAGALAELFHKVLAKDFPHLDVARARIVVVEMADDLLASFSARAREHATARLRRRGVSILTGRAVAKVDAGRVWLDDGESIAARTLIWAAGVTPTGLPATLGLPTGRGGRVEVEPDLSVPGHPDVWVVGDLAAATDGEGQLLPQVAQPAIQGGHHVAEQITRRSAGQPTRPFAYRDKGSMATIGRHSAVADLPGGIHLRGTLGWVAWLALHIVTLMGFRNRLSVLVNWAWNYLTWDRGTRLILEPQSRGPGRGAEEASAVVRLGSMADSAEVQIATAGVELPGDLAVPDGATGVVLFAHGSGSSRHSPRNRQVAQHLNDEGLATLLLDLLTAEEDAVDVRTRELRFDIPMLGRRLVGAVDWLQEREDTGPLAVGTFGASTGAAAALIAAAERPTAVVAVVSRGGRPDLAAPRLATVRAPTLLIVGGDDWNVLALNEEAAESLRCPHELAIVPHAGHLFEEPGALEQVAALAGEWFLRHLPAAMRQRAA